ncbi:response regulator transcription factor [Motiliproteus sp. MSK22-1]|uniref:response regulator transcription factor n=1 Tax=Motiliproteus sp. MSK22-1 TaxID=1897630 RepID=UPI001300DC14|nr:response regulator transcription factor [Motiliproteus sp. MSK22-1]
MNNLIAIVEDDPDQRQNYEHALRKRHYRVSSYGTRQQALAGIKEQMPDLAILDVMLTDEFDGGFKLCSELLQLNPDLPIIFLSSRSDEIDQVFGLRLGAWDYQTKPVSLTLLAERIAALLKVASNRKQQPPEPDLYGDLELDIERVAVSWKTQRISLTVTECAILDVIVSKEGGVASYDELAKATRQTLVTNNTVNTHIRHIRRKFQDADSMFDQLENVYSAGYRWKEQAS